MVQVWFSGLIGLHLAGPLASSGVTEAERWRVHLEEPP